MGLIANLMGLKIIVIIILSLSESDQFQEEDNRVSFLIVLNTI